MFRKKSATNRDASPGPSASPTGSPRAAARPSEGIGRRWVRILGLGGGPDPAPRASPVGRRGSRDASPTGQRASRPSRGRNRSASPAASPLARQAAVGAQPQRVRRTVGHLAGGGSSSSSSTADAEVAELAASCLALPDSALRRLVARLQQKLHAGSDELVVTKAPDDPIGVSCDADCLRLDSAQEGSAAEVAGAAAFVGRILTHANDEPVSSMGQLRALAKGRRTVVLRFAPSNNHSDPHGGLIGWTCSRKLSVDSDGLPLRPEESLGNDSGNGRTLRGVQRHILENFGIEPGALVVYNDKLLGTGSFGKVLRGDYQATEVAVKVQRAERALRVGEVDEWKREVKIMTRLRHPNVLMLLGACFEEGQLMIVTELCESGTLRNVIKDCRQRKVVYRWGQKIDWCMQIAKGMAYLHHKQIHHRDLKPANIFVSNNTMKVADFGLSKLRKAAHREVPRDTSVGKGARDSARLSWVASQGTALRDSFALPSALSPKGGNVQRDPFTGDRMRILPDGRRRPCSNSQASIPGTFAFIAPEVWQEQPYTDAADVYSFGVSCVEVITGYVPFDEDTASDCSWRIMTGRSRPQLPSELKGKKVPSGLRATLQQCMDFDEESRCSFVEVVRRLRIERSKEYAGDSSPPWDAVSPGSLGKLQVNGPPHPRCKDW
eukprot:TRINITY_DN9422_c2_g1_i1.p1 TRINITY_DN9422_c2_g1~~TRINITY_DN9422_c2_g1_i1.p1  ORF type:complete len:708 (+),score=176.65 TRINITY_DN9422_c2_g1_i1:135-2126(+)